MPHHYYPFIRFQYPDGTIRGHTYVPIRVINPSTNSSLLSLGLLDTGADACLFPAELASALGHDLKSSGVKSSVTSGIEQTSVTTYKHTFRIELLPSDMASTVWSSTDSEIDCAKSNPPVILGVADFLSFFRLTIDYRKEQILLDW